MAAGRKRGSGAAFTAEERAAMRELARERRAEARWAKDRAAGERAVLEKIAELPEPDRSMAERIHAIVTTAAPELSPRTWYGMPAYANKEAKVVCFFKPASKFGERYATFGFDTAATSTTATCGRPPSPSRSSRPPRRPRSPRS